MVKLDLIIPVYNRREITIQGLKNLSESLSYYAKAGRSLVEINIIVVDDGSTDGTSEWISENRSEITLLKGDGSLWWAGAINMGAQFSKNQGRSTHVLLWNDDTICEIDYFVQLENILLEDEKYLGTILVSKIFWLNDKQRLFNFGGMFNPKNGKKTLIGLNNSDVYNKVLKVDWSGGMGTLIPVNMFSDLNYIDNKNFPQYHGDIDLFLRAKEKGFITYAIPSLKIYNNAETTGIIMGKNFKDFKVLIRSNSSLHNLKQNCYFTKRHTNTPISWVLLAKTYCSLAIRLIL